MTLGAWLRIILFFFVLLPSEPAISWDPSYDFSLEVVTKTLEEFPAIWKRCNKSEANRIITNGCGN
jgi:hypothetical protein